MDKRTNATILLVEGDRIQATAGRAFLESRGYRVILVSDGKAAIKAARTRDIDLILMDPALPDMSGNEVARWLRLNSDTKDIPIISLGSTGAATEGTVTEAGAGDCTVDPCNEVELEARIRESLRTRSLDDGMDDDGRQSEDLTLACNSTGLPDRRYFENALEKEFSKAARRPLLSCIIVSIDNFRGLTETSGRDAVLLQTASLLKNSVRSSDVVAHLEIGEFAVLLTDTAPEDAVVVRGRILDAVASHNFPNVPERITLSIGTAGGPSIDSPAKLLREAELALRKEKQRSEK